VKAVVVGLAAAMALAFGFGCQDMAKKALSDWIEKIQEKK
jgi:hypothetical protein